MIANNEGAIESFDNLAHFSDDQSAKYMEHENVKPLFPNNKKEEPQPWVKVSGTLYLY